VPVTSMDKFLLQAGGLEHMVMVHIYFFFSLFFFCVECLSISMYAPLKV